MTLNDTAVALERLTPGGLASLDAWWRAANYLTIGQIYLKDNALLRHQLTPEHIKPRLLGHWGTSPGLSFVYAHVSRLISVTRSTRSTLRGRDTAARRWWRPPGWKEPTARSIPP